MTLEKNFDEAKENLRQGAIEGLWESSGAWLTEANKKVPHDEGTLERSGTVRQGKLPDAESVFSKAESSQQRTDYRMDFEDGPLSYYVAYNTPYAIKLHEATAGEFDFRGAGERKWLENTHKKLSGDMEQYVRNEMRKKL